MEQFTFKQTDGPEIRFTGEFRAKATSHRNNAWRWTELHAYETEGGNWIVHEIGKTTIEGEVEFHTVHVFGSTDDLTRYFGFTKLAMKLYDRLGIDAITVA